MRSEGSSLSLISRPESRISIVRPRDTRRERNTEGPLKEKTNREILSGQTSRMFVTDRALNLNRSANSCLWSVGKRGHRTVHWPEAADWSGLWIVCVLRSIQEWHVHQRCACEHRDWRRSLRGHHQHSWSTSRERAKGRTRLLRTDSRRGTYVNAFRSNCIEEITLNNGHVYSDFYSLTARRYDLDGEKQSNEATTTRKEQLAKRRRGLHSWLIRSIRTLSLSHPNNSSVGKIPVYSQWHFHFRFSPTEQNQFQKQTDRTHPIATSTDLFHTDDVCLAISNSK